MTVCSQVAGGLDALCASGLVHRDVKPANILLDEDEIAYITDFGLAKDSQASVLTRPGQALGSIDYMAPEQIRGEEVGRRERRVRARLRHVRVPDRGAPVRRPAGNARPVGPSPGRAGQRSTTKRTDLPPEISDVVMRALDKDPANRPETAGEFARMFEAAAGGAG